VVCTLLERTEVYKGCWRDVGDVSRGNRGISPGYYQMSKGRDPLEVAYATSPARLGAATAREGWKRRHRRALRLCSS
jgi:hypothetical protein